MKKMKIDKDINDFFIDNYLFKAVRGRYLMNSEVAKNKDISYAEKKDRYPIEALKSPTEALITDFELGYFDGDFKFISDLKEEYKNDAGRLIRLHQAIKKSRNMTNHASDGIRPSLHEIENGINNYLILADKVLKKENFN